MHASSTPPKPTRYFVGLDVLRDTIAACFYYSVARRPCYETEFCAQTPIKLTRFVDLVYRRFGEFRACYEASFCGYILYKDLTSRGVKCAVIAPEPVPRRSSDRIKNDQRDAKKLAEYYAAGLLRECFIPDQEFEAARSLVRSRTELIQNVHRTKMREMNLLSAREKNYTSGGYWTQRFMIWINQIKLDEPNDAYLLQSYLEEIAYIQARTQETERQIERTAALPRFLDSVQILQGFRGIGLMTVMQLMTEIGNFSQFEHPTASMSYLGLIPSQHSSGRTIRHNGGITKTGSSLARKTRIVAAWKYIYPPRVTVSVQKRQQHCGARVVQISQRTQKRLFKRYLSLTKRRPPKVAVVAIAHELVGFQWEAMQPVPEK